MKSKKVVNKIIEPLLVIVSHCLSDQVFPSVRYQVGPLYVHVYVSTGACGSRSEANLGDHSLGAIPLVSVFLREGKDWLGGHQAGRPSGQ